MVTGVGMDLPWSGLLGLAITSTCVGARSWQGGRGLEGRGLGTPDGVGVGRGGGEEDRCLSAFYANLLMAVS